MEQTDSWEAGADPKGRSGSPAVCGLEALFYLVKAGLIPEEWGWGVIQTGGIWASE